MMDGTSAVHTAPTIALGLQRHLNVDGCPVLRISDDTEYVELDGDLFVKLFDLER